LIRRKEGISSLLAGLVGPVIAVSVKWPSVALLELFGIIIIDIWVILFTISIKSIEVKKRKILRPA